MKYKLLSAETAHNAEIEAIIATAFGSDRHKRHINRLREGCEPYHLGGIVAKDDKHILGSIRYFLAQAESGESFPCLGPLAVLPHIRGCGIGKALIQTSLDKLKQAGHEGILIVGDNGYYAPFGFSPEAVVNLDLGGQVAPLTFMGLEWSSDCIKKAKGKISFIKNPND